MLCSSYQGHFEATPPHKPQHRHFGDVVAGQGGLELLSSSWSLVRGVMGHCKQDDDWSLVVGVWWVGVGVKGGCGAGNIRHIAHALAGKGQA